MALGPRLREPVLEAIELLLERVSSPVLPLAPILLAATPASCEGKTGCSGWLLMASLALCVLGPALANAFSVSRGPYMLLFATLRSNIPHVKGPGTKHAGHGGWHS